MKTAIGWSLVALFGGTVAFGVLWYVGAAFMQAVRGERCSEAIGGSEEDET